MQSASELIEALLANPSRFRATGGYERMLKVLGRDPSLDAVNRALREHSNIAGDILWTLSQLENVRAFANVAVGFLSSTHNATAAYAMEIVLRGGEDSATLSAAIRQLELSNDVVCEHAVRTLAGEGSIRIAEIVKDAPGTWSDVSTALSSGRISPVILSDLVGATSRARKVIGVALVTLAYERDKHVIDILRSSTEGWIREYCNWMVGA